jgi:hypothetical protein
MRKLMAASHRPRAVVLTRCLPWTRRSGTTPGTSRTPAGLASRSPATSPSRTGRRTVRGATAPCRCLRRRAYWSGGPTVLGRRAAHRSSGRRTGKLAEQLGRGHASGRAGCGPVRLWGHGSRRGRGPAARRAAEICRAAARWPADHWYTPDLIRSSWPSRHSAELAALTWARVTRFPDSSTTWSKPSGRAASAWIASTTAMTLSRDAALRREARLVRRGSRCRRP